MFGKTASILMLVCVTIQAVCGAPVDAVSGDSSSGSNTPFIAGLIGGSVAVIGLLAISVYAALNISIGGGGKKAACLITCAKVCPCCKSCLPSPGL